MNKKDKIEVIILIVFIILLIIPTFFTIIKAGINRKNNNGLFDDEIENYEEIQKNKEKNNEEEYLDPELKIVSDYINSELEYIDEIRSLNKEPFIPEGFKYVDGSIDDGYIIEDENNNQFVWVPCYNIDLIDKTNFVKEPFISYEDCYDENYEEFLDSIINNKGFYISRFEIGKEDNVAVSKKDSEVYRNINIDEAKKIVDSMYLEDDFKHEIINGLAYDITLNWIMSDSDDKIVKDRKVAGETSIISGNSMINNIYDITDNILEFTTEKTYDDVCIIRGFYKYEKNNPSDLEELDNRFCISPNDSMESLGIRTIIYK